MQKEVSADKMYIIVLDMHKNIYSRDDMESF